MAVVAISFVEGARWFLNTSRADSFMRLNSQTRLSTRISTSLWACRWLDFFSPARAGHYRLVRSADSIYAVQQSRESLDVRVGMGSTIAAFEGQRRRFGGSIRPSCALYATMTEVLLKYIRIKIDRRVFIACGVVGAISAGFNAPIAGVLFTTKLLAPYSVGLRPYCCDLHRCLRSQSGFLRRRPTFSVPDMPIELQPLIPYLILTAVLSTGSAIAYMAAIRKGRDLAGQSGWSMTKLMCSCVLVVGTVGVLLPDVTGLGLVQVNQMIGAEFNLVLVMQCRIFVTAYCLNAGFLGGVFGPALSWAPALAGLLYTWPSLPALSRTLATLCRWQPSPPSAGRLSERRLPSL